MVAGRSRHRLARDVSKPPISAWRWAAGGSPKSMSSPRCAGACLRTSARSPNPERSRCTRQSQPRMTIWSFSLIGLDEREQLSPTAAQPVKTGVSRCRVTRGEQATGKIAVTIDPRALCAIFGVTDPDVATRLLSQVVNVLQPDPGKSVDAAVVDQALAMIEGIGPSDTLEAMTATLLVCVQHAAHDSMRRALHPDQTPSGRAIYGALALKTMRTYAQLLEAHNHGRGKGVTQQIIVKHVSVEPAATPSSALSRSTGGGGDGKSRRQSRRPVADDLRQRSEETAR
jgi:hypothetical protein